MEDEIIRKVVNRTPRISGEIVKPSYRSSKIQMLCKMQTVVQPFMQSTPHRRKRKSLDEGYCTPRKQKSQNSSLIDNITPIQKKPSKLKCTASHKFKMLEVKNRTAKKQNKNNNLNTLFNCETSNTPPSAQAQLLSQDDSFLEAIDLDIAVKDYLDSHKKREFHFNKPVLRKRCGSPDFFDGSDQENYKIQDNVESIAHLNGVVNSSIAKNSRVSSSCDVHISENYKEKNNVLTFEKSPKINGDNVLTNDLDINVDWDNDSLLDEVVKEGNLVIPVSPVPLAEKIRQTLITNVQKPIVYKPKTPDFNANLQQIVPESEDEAAYFDIGPFYGLPSKVKSLLQKLKGISDLYCKYVSILLNVVRVCNLQFLLIVEHIKILHLVTYFIIITIKQRTHLQSE